MIKMLVVVICIFLLLLAISAAFFVNLHPAMGGDHTDKRKKEFTLSPNYSKGKFQNQIETNMDLGFFGFLSVLKEFIVGDPSRQPKEPLEISTFDVAATSGRDSAQTFVTWFGHSSVLLETAGKKILLDPMFGPSPAPEAWLGPKRFNEAPVKVSELPDIDIVLISHDHYDHLDYPTMLELKKKVKLFLVPLGVGTHLAAWGISKDKIRELDWWEETQVDSFKMTCTPARHFSGRGLFNRYTTLWASWVIQGPGVAIYFSGDSGYGPHFKEIGEKLGPFDLAMMECGQYDEKWESIHMLPDQTVQASEEINAKQVMPIHWGAFKLALHSWKDPVQKLVHFAQDRKINLITPEINKTFSIPASSEFKTNWWKTVD